MTAAHPRIEANQPPHPVVDLPKTGEHIAFYRFIEVADVNPVVQRLRELTTGLGGSVVVAPEGVNGMLAGAPPQLDAFLAAASTDALTGALFAGIDMKRTTYERPPFRRCTVKGKKEIVPLGIDGLDMPSRMADVHAADVPPAQWRDLIHRDDVVVLDNRNSFEYGVGHFEHAVDPGVENFRDFTAYVRAHADEWRENGTTVAMYCTGGIRCEKSSPWMQDLGLDVRQLQGGILNYFAQVPDAERDWHGECFVFDERVTLDTKLHDVGRRAEEIDEPR